MRNINMTAFVRKSAKQQAISDIKKELKKSNKSFFTYDSIIVDEEEMKKIVKNALNEQKKIKK